RGGGGRGGGEGGGKVWGGGWGGGGWREDPGYVVDRPPHQRLRCFKRAEGRMRGESHVLHARQRVVRLERLGVKNVEPGVADVATCERIEERSFFDQRSARGVDENHASLGARKALGVDEAARLVAEGKVQRNYVGPRQQFIEADER